MPADATTGPPKPVMLFFYGGSDDTGSAMFPLYAGGNLVNRTGEIVVITVNYRLNAFGWLGSDFLRGNDGSTGNW
jgi:carboxylesterase type B